MDSRTNGRRNKLLLLSAVLCFGVAVAGFFLSWGITRGGNADDPFDTMPIRYSIMLYHTGKNASIYGYAQLICGAVGLLAAAVGLIRNQILSACRAGALFAALIGLLFHLLMRLDPRVKVLGSIGYALSHSDLSLGYPVGPGLGLAAFLAALACSGLVRAEKMGNTTGGSDGGP